MKFSRKISYQRRIRNRTHCFQMLSTCFHHADEKSLCLILINSFCSKLGFAFCSPLILALLFVSKLTWTFSPFIAPCRLAHMKKASYCAMQGLKKLQAALTNDAEVKCESCVKLLEMSGYSKQKHQEAVDAWINGNEAVARGEDIKMPEDKQEEARDGEGEPEDESKKKGGAQDEGKLGISAAEKLEQLFQQFAPIIKILPPGTRNKKVPYHCTVCKTRRFPKGKIGELSKRKYKTCRHFLLKHVRSPMHQRYLRAAQAADDPIITAVGDEEMRPCEALCVNDSRNAGKLYIFRDQFALWATYANLADWSQHKYWHEASEDAWYIRSKDCQEETDEKAAMGKVICAACKSLGDSHSVPLQVDSGQVF